MTKGVANQSCSNTFPSGQINVRLKPTGGAGVRSEIGQIRINVFHNNDMNTSCSKSNVTDISLTFELNRFYKFWTKKMKKGLILVVVIDLQHPAVFITFKSDDKRLVKINTCSFARLPK